MGSEPPSSPHSESELEQFFDLALGTGGAVVKALPLLGEAPFFHVNADTLWIDGVRSNLARLAETFDPERMDILLLMAPTTSSIGYGGRGDYAMLADGALSRIRGRTCDPLIGSAGPQMKVCGPE